MRRAFVVFAAATGCFAVSASASAQKSTSTQQSASAPMGASAQQVTRTFDYKPVDGIQSIQLVLDDVKVDQIVFRTAKDVATVPRQRSNSETVVRVVNDSQGPVAVGVAVVAMDEGGHIVAAGSGGTRTGWLEPGGRDSVAIRFPYVYRNLAKARKFTLTIEVDPRPVASVPAPAATGP
jgi:hypothetical protein